MPERTLILLRHAKSDWSGGEADIDRPLIARGRRQAAEAGRWLARNIPAIDLAVVSPANRASSTWALAAAELAAAELDPAPPLRVEELAYAASARQLLAIVRDLPDDLGTVVLVGHNPGIEELAALLVGKPVVLSTSALAVIGLGGAWSSAGQAAGTLLALGRPPTDLVE